MEGFITWWNGLPLAGQIFACAAIPATVILALQTILLLFGMGGGSAEADTDTDFDHDTVGDESAEDMNAADAEGVRILTVRGLVAFFAVGGWAGVALIDYGVMVPVAAIIALLLGLSALMLVAYIVKWSLKLQENGTLIIRDAVAHTATVYIPIPPKRIGRGKVNLTLQERYVELDAVTDAEEPIQTGTMVQVVAVSSCNVLIVRPISL